MQDKELLTFFGAKVQQIRTHKGLSQETLAELTDLDRTYISSIERGRRNVSLINIYRLITALDCRPQELFPVKGEAL